MITRDLSLPALNTSGATVQNKTKVENKVKVENKEKVKKKAKVKRNTPAETTTIKEERYSMPICSLEEDNKVKVESLFPGANANLAGLPTGTEQLKLGKHPIGKMPIQFRSKLGV
jgi:hypothetical protein